MKSILQNRKARRRQASSLEAKRYHLRPAEISCRSQPNGETPSAALLLTPQTGAKNRKRKSSALSPLADMLADNAKRNSLRHVQQAPSRLSNEPDVFDQLEDLGKRIDFLKAGANAPQSAAYKAKRDLSPVPVCGTCRHGKTSERHEGILPCRPDMTSDSQGCENWEVLPELRRGVPGVPAVG
jgi:hypothetical protein